MMADPDIRASGVISVMSNIAPGALVKMVQAFRSGDTAKARDLGAQLDPLFKLVVCKVAGSRRLPDGRDVPCEDRFRNPLPVKTMMAGLGMPVGLCRRPLGKMTKTGVDRCRQALVTVQKNAPEVLAPIAQAFGVNIEQRLADDTAWAELTR
jgi:4-hydroxy-tetrahydrodipicolinate synthase